MIPSPETPRESAECCLEVLNISSVRTRRLADIFVDALEGHLTMIALNVNHVAPEDPEDEDAYNRLFNRTFGFIKPQAIQKPDTALRMYAVLAHMRAAIAWRGGDEGLIEALRAIADRRRPAGNEMLDLIRALKKV